MRVLIDCRGYFLRSGWTTHSAGLFSFCRDDSVVAFVLDRVIVENRDCTYMVNTYFVLN